MDIHLVLYYLLCLVIALVISQTDVCVNYTTLNSTKYKTDYTVLSRNVTIQADWYRYMGTTSGVIATSCPTQTNACGAKNQIWIKGALPTFGSGIQSIPSCVRTSRKCCELQNKLNIKHCDGFFVYYLTPPAAGSNYCFNVTAPDLFTVAMLQSTTQDTTAPDLSTVTIPQTTTLGPSQDTTAPDLSTVTMPQTTTLGPSPGHTQHYTVTQATHGTRALGTSDLNSVLNQTTGATAVVMLSTPIGNARSSEINQPTTESQPLIGVVTGSVVGCVVFVLAVTAAVYYFKKIRGYGEVSHAHHGTDVNPITTNPGIKNTKFNAQRLYGP